MHLAARHLLALVLLCTCVLALPARAAETRLDPDHPQSMGTDQFWECRRMIGVAGGVLPTAGVWEFVGEGATAVTGSFLLAFSCEVGAARAAAMFGVESAPFLQQRRFDKQGTLFPQWITATLGLTLGGNKMRYGPVVSGGIGYVGAGGRFMFMPLRGRRGARMGMEVRLLAWFSDRVSGQLQLMWQFSSTRIRIRRGEGKRKRKGREEIDG